jgi:pimeloyl-ACP methyl ester carboxylesterase
MPHFTTADGTKLYFEDNGQGLPILCLPGLTRNTRDFDHVAPHLADHRMIAMDYRGRGQSGWADPASYTIPQEAADVLALLDHLGLEKVAILGTSRGGLIAMGLAAMAKTRLIGMCLNDIGPDIAPEGMDKIKGYLGRNPRFTSIAEMVVAMPSLNPQFANVPGARWEVELRNHFNETPEGLRINYDPALRDAVLATGAAPAPDLWPFFDALADLPLALIRGANSDLLTLETAQEMARRRPDMIWADVPDRGHVPFLDEPESLTAVQRWIDVL